jgi:hypothetical protein
MSTGDLTTEIVDQTQSVLHTPCVLNKSVEKFDDPPMFDTKSINLEVVHDFLIIRYHLFL